MCKNMLRLFKNLADFNPELPLLSRNLFWMLVQQEHTLHHVKNYASLQKTVYLALCLLPPVTAKTDCISMQDKHWTGRVQLPTLERLLMPPVT